MNATQTHTGPAPATETYARVTSGKLSDSMTIWTAWVYRKNRKRYRSFDAYSERAIAAKLKNMGVEDVRYE